MTWANVAAYKRRRTKCKDCKKPFTEEDKHPIRCNDCVTKRTQ